MFQYLTFRLLPTLLCYSLSMKGEKFAISQAVAKAVIKTLTKQDYVNVVCARASHWDEVGKYGKDYFDNIFHVT